MLSAIGHWLAQGGPTDWLQGVGTVGAFGGVLYEFRRRRKDDEASAKEKLHQQAAQARLVTTKIKWAAADADHMVTDADVEVHNLSHDPIRSVVVTGALSSAGQKTFRVGALPGGLGSPKRLTWVLPTPVAMSDFIDPEKARAFVTFIDADGLRWVRRGEDEPQRLYDPDEMPPPGATPRQRGAWVGRRQPGVKRQR